MTQSINNASTMMTQQVNMPRTAPMMSSLLSFFGISVDVSVNRRKSCICRYYKINNDLCMAGRVGV